MVYISSWQEYQEAAEALYEKSPNKVCTLLRLWHTDADQVCPMKTRYVVKWRASEGKMVLKITDDTTVRLTPILYFVLSLNLLYSALNSKLTLLSS